MAARAIRKGDLEIGELGCPVALHAAASMAEPIGFHILNQRTGHRVERVYVDVETEEPVERGNQVKGYTTEDGKSVLLEPEEIAAAVPESDKRLRVPDLAEHISRTKRGKFDPTRFEDGHDAAKAG